MGLRQSRAEPSRAVGCSRGAGGQIMLQQGQRAPSLTALCLQWTHQDHCHCILRAFTLFKDKCIVNFVSPNTRYLCCLSSCSQRWALLPQLQDMLQMKSNVFLTGAELLNPTCCHSALGLWIALQRPVGRENNRGRKLCLCI